MQQGVVAARLDRVSNRVRVEYDPALISSPRASQVADRLAQALRERMATCGIALALEECPACPMPLVIPNGPGVHGVAPRASVERDLAAKDLPSDRARCAAWWRDPALSLALACGLTLAVGFALETWAALSYGVPLTLYLAAYVAGGSVGMRETIATLREGRLDVNALMLIAALGAAALDEWAEGAVLLFLFSLSNALEGFALGRTRRSISALLELNPGEAVRLRGEMTERVPVEVLEVGDLVLVRPGARVPLDGVVISGRSTVDESAVTGEAQPVEKAAGAVVLAGTLNGHGAVEVRITTPPGEDTLSKIVALVEAAHLRKARAERLVERLTRVYAPLVIAAAGLTALVPLLLGAPPGPTWYRAITLLVVASPCALVLATPVAVLAATSLGARRGALIKGGHPLEALGTVETIALDKTGTLTTGALRVADVLPAAGREGREVLELAASVEVQSEHPLAVAVVVAARARGLELPPCAEFESHPGGGAHGVVHGRLVRVGSERWLASQGVAPSSSLQALARLREAAGETVVYVSLDGALAGAIVMADTLRRGAAEALARLRPLGVRRLAMLTGDSGRVARALGERLALDAVHAELLPQDKQALLGELSAEGRGVAMVGDGVNDAPALASATVGIAMGAAGSDVAMEAADVVLMTDDLARLPEVIALGRRARRIILQNLFFATGVALSLVVVTLLFGLPLPLAVIGHEGSTLLVVANGLRLLGNR